MPVPDLIVSGADDPSAFSFRDTTPTATGTGEPPDPAKLFNAEWDAAQQRYRAAVNSGFTESDASQLYLDPVKNKWSILQDVPETMKRAAAVDLDQAQKAFVAGVQSGYKANDAENIYLKPAEQKWQAAASIPDESPEKKAADQKDIAGFLETVRSGYDPTQVMQDVPERLWKITGFQREWVAAASAGQSLRSKEAAAEAKTKAKTEAQADPEAAMKKLEPIYNFLSEDKYRTNAPPELIENLQQKRKALEQEGSKPAEPIGVSPGGGDQIYATKYRSPAEVTAAFTSKELTRDEAKKILQDQFGYK